MRKVCFVLLLAAVAVATLGACGSGDRDETAVAPDFTLANAASGQTSLSDLREGHTAVVIVFYRGIF